MLDRIFQGAKVLIAAFAGRRVEGIVGDIGQHHLCVKEFRIHLRGLAHHVDGRFPVFRTTTVVTSPGCQECIIGGDVARTHLQFAHAQRDAQRIGDGPCDVLLDGKDVVQLTVVGFRPQVVAIVSLDQLGGDAHPVASLAHAAFQHMRDPELRGDVRDIPGVALEVERRGAAGHVQAPHLGELVEQLLRNAVGKILLVLFRTHVDEGQHSDGVFVDPGIGWQRRDRLRPRLRRQRTCLLLALGALDALRRQLEGPGQDDRKGEADDQKDDDGGGEPGGQVQWFLDDGNDLRDQPGHDRIHDRDLEDVTTPQFGEQASHIGPSG